MSIEAQMAKQELQEMKSRVHNFVSTVGNALERIAIYIDEDDPDEAKREIEELREGLSRVGG